MTGMNNIKIPGVCKSHTISAATIIRVEASGNYSRIYFEDGSRLLTAKVLRWFQQTLPADMFARVHRGHLVNKLFVKEMEGVQTKKLLMHNGESIAVSRRRKNEIVAVIAA